MLGLIGRRLCVSFLILGIAMFAAGMLSTGDAGSPGFDPAGFFRLHVIANSDSPADQDLKLKVRDGIIVEAARILATATDVQTTESLLSENLGRLEEAARRVIAREGFDYEVKAFLGSFEFPEKAYDESLVLPAGRYRALRVIIGKGQGSNWWCILFPPLCFPGIGEADESVNLRQPPGKSAGEPAGNKVEKVEKVESKTESEKTESENESVENRIEEVRIVWKWRFEDTPFYRLLARISPGQGYYQSY